MSKIQKNFTTPEQSRRLLELGVPAISADCYYRSIYPATLEVKPSEFFKPSEPCWSVGQLIKICLKCSTLEQRQVCFFCNGDDDEYSLIDYVVTALESGVMTHHIDFSKW